MKTRPRCKACLYDLAKRVVTLSEGSDELTVRALHIVDAYFDANRSPTAISNRLLKEIGRMSGVRDPFVHQKRAEFERAREALEKLRGFFPESFEGALKASAFGNGGDFFVEHDYDTSAAEFHCDVDKIGYQVYLSTKILILGDNPGDLVFDMPLVRTLKRLGKEVFYAVKAAPVQNDMSTVDVGRLGIEGLENEIVSTGTDEVGIRREEMSGVVRECWEDGSCLIAKGMGNYETISEYDGERPIIHIMKVKCATVAEAVGRKVGEYIAIVGGDHG
jgi:uncharacterized protein with ATP-grasp and redox domains